MTGVSACGDIANHLQLCMSEALLSVPLCSLIQRGQAYLYPVICFDSASIKGGDTLRANHLLAGANATVTPPLYTPSVVPFLAQK